MLESPESIPKIIEQWQRVKVSDDKSIAESTELEKLCSKIHNVLELPYTAKKRDKISHVLETNRMDCSVLVAGNDVRFYIHPGFEQTLEDIELHFETDYVDVYLFMVGYLEYCGSDNFVMVGEDGKVYQVEDEILYIVKEDLYRYLTEGTKKNLGYYDFYRHLGSEGSKDCIGWKE